MARLLSGYTLHVRNQHAELLVELSQVRPRQSIAKEDIAIGEGDLVAI